ncbi:MAG: hypothetical protein QOD99_1476, partial [Chthoniobacter sp.]|nr:hypothetical protein [Chthoniobacter sp.]
MSKSERAYIAPFATFMLLLTAMPLVRTAASSSSSLAAYGPEHLVYPAQALICGALLLLWRRHYPIANVVNLP